MVNIDWNDDADEDLNDEPSRVFEFPIGMDGPILYIRRSQPHGMLEFATEKGPVPKVLEGRWTDIEMCKRAGQTYIDATVSPAKFNPKGEPARIKNETETKRTDSMRKTFRARKGVEV